jgi:CspA family cold shock protein
VTSSSTRPRWPEYRSAKNDPGAPDDGTPDLFVHHSAIKAGGFRGLQENQRVEFTPGQGVKGPQAEEVHMI